MKITIKAKNASMNREDLAYLEKKLMGLQTYVKGFEKAAVQLGLLADIGKETDRRQKGDIFSVALRLRIPGKMLVAKAMGEDVMKTAVQAREELEMELRKQKTKTIEVPRRKAQKAAKP